MNTIDDVKEIILDHYSDKGGSLIPVEGMNQIPFDIKRIFYIYGVDGQKKRGNHAHHETKQVLICLSGKCTIICRDGSNNREIVLDSPERAVYVPEMIWEEVVYHTPQSVLLALTDTLYDKSDYIDDYDIFLESKVVSHTDTRTSFGIGPDQK